MLLIHLVHVLDHAPLSQLFVFEIQLIFFERDLLFEFPVGDLRPLKVLAMRNVNIVLLLYLKDVHAAGPLAELILLVVAQASVLDHIDLLRLDIDLVQFKLLVLKRE